MSKRTRRETKDDEVVEKGGDRKFNFTWKEEGGLIHGDCGTKPSDKILSFDMHIIVQDGTLIKTKSGAKFAKNEKDWVILNEKVVSVVKEYYEKGYKIVIMTNQGGVEKGHTTVKGIESKIEDIVEFIGVPIQVLIAAYTNQYRKPAPGMWKFLTQKLNGGVAINLKESMYCGDAAGRPKEGARPADHDSTDYKFALNVGIAFKTPEMLFFGTKETLPAIEFDPKKYKTAAGTTVLKGKDVSKIKSGSKEMIIFVGSPGSGKSTLWRTYLSDYVRVNNDTLKTKAKCLKTAEEGLQAGKSVVIDNTNPGRAVRKEYIDLAKKYDYPVRCFYFEIPKELAFHLDDLREYNTHRQHESKRVGKMPIHTFYKNVEAPKLDEGFAEVETVEFVPGPFKNKDDEELFYCYISSKR